MGKEALKNLAARLNQKARGSDLTNKVLANTVYGNLGREIQEKIRGQDYNPRNATLVSSAVNVPIYAGIAGLTALFTGGDAGAAAGLAATYAGLEGAVRSYCSLTSGKGTASLPGKMLGMPAELAVNVYNKIMKSVSKKSKLRPQYQRIHDEILTDLDQQAANPEPRKHSPKNVQRMYAQEAAKQNKAGKGMLKFIGEAGVGAVMGALYEIHPTVADGANATFGMIGLTNFAVSGNKLRTVPALLTGYCLGRVAVKAMKYQFDVQPVPMPNQIQKPSVPNLDYV